mgnify:CR=1
MQLFELLLEERAIAHAPPSASAKSQMRLPELKPAMSELSKACVDDTLVSPALFGHKRGCVVGAPGG